MAECTGRMCPMQVGFKVNECNDLECPYRTEPMTNGDRIRAMSDEELARFIDSETDNCAPHGDCKKVCDDCKACWLDWLQRPAEEG